MRGIASLLPFALMGGFIAIFIAVAYFSSRAQKKRTAAMQAIADSMGLPFDPDGDPMLVQELSTFQLFSQGRRKLIRNMIHGEADDVRVAIFDYQYTIGSGKNSHTYSQTVGSIQAPDLDLPEFSLRPEHLFHKLAGVFGYADVDFDSHPQFSKSYLLRGPNEHRIRGLFNPALLEFFEGRNGICVESRGTRFIYFRSAKRIEPAAVRDWLDEGLQMLRHLREAAR